MSFARVGDDDTATIRGEIMEYHVTDENRGKQRPPKLSEEVVKALPKPREGSRIHYFSGSVLQGLTAPAGFGVRVTANGAKSFVLDYRVGGKLRRFTIGTWPTWSVVKAIKTARDLRVEIDKGHDPQAKKEQARTPVPQGKTVASVLDDFVARYVRAKDRPLRGADHVERAFERLVKPRVGKLGIYDLRRSHIVQMLDAIEDQNGPVMADRTLAYLRKALNWFASRDDEFNIPIAKGMARTKPAERARTRILADDEIRDLWTALDKVETQPRCFVAFVRALLLTAQRRSEVAGMRWDELDGETWIIPPARFKSNRAQVVPVTKTVRGIIGTKPAQPPKGKGVFAFSSDEGATPFSGFGKPKIALDAKIAEIRKQDGRAPMPHWTYHDLRRSARSLMARAGVSADVAERVLGHVIPGVRGVYDRHSYLDEKREALEKLAALVEMILNPPAGNVTSLADQKRKTKKAVAS
jgi:integrase